MFSSYLQGIKVTDGIEGWFGKPRRVVLYSDQGEVETIFTDGTSIRGYKIRKGRKVVQQEQFGKYYREPGLYVPYHKNTKRGIHGVVVRDSEMFMDSRVRCRTQYSCGRFLWQECRYRNGVRAYHFHHSDKVAEARYSNGQKALRVECPDGFPTSRNNPQTGEVYFEHAITENTFGGSYNITRWSRAGQVLDQGAVRNRQRDGEWIVNGRPVFFVRGVQVSKKLWDTPPDKLTAKMVLRVKNAQMRMALIARMGYERFVKQAKGKLIHKDKKRGNKLLEFPQVRVSDGNGREKGSALRILVVTCTSTKQLYYLNVPDFVWDGGKRTKLNTCEQARQWTFGVNDPRKKIEFAQEA